MRHFYFLSIFCLTLSFASCSDQPQTEKKDSMPAQTAEHDSVQPGPARPLQVEARTFEATDSTGKKTGWGYDLYVDGKRTIHQPIIPAVSGNSAFHSEADAKKTGDYAAQKFMRTGQFPSITLDELDSLGIK